MNTIASPKINRNVAPKQTIDTIATIRATNAIVPNNVNIIIMLPPIYKFIVSLFAIIGL